MLSVCATPTSDLQTSSLEQHNECTTDLLDIPTEPTEVITRDEYEVTEDGHFKGNDGFIVPANFSEFHEQFPMHVRNFVRRHMLKDSFADREDRVSELNLFLMTLPEKSKFREPGTNGLAGGCQDRIQIFHPDRSYGASRARFLYFVNFMMSNHFVSLTKKTKANPVQRKNNFGYVPHDEGYPYYGTFMLDDEAIHRLSSTYQEAAHCSMDLPVLIDEFRAFLVEQNPELTVVFNVLADADTYLEAQTALGMSEQLFTRARNRLNVLMECFHSGADVPRQRKIYRPRVKQQDGGSGPAHAFLESYA